MKIIKYGGYEAPMFAEWTARPENATESIPAPEFNFVRVTPRCRKHVLSARITDKRLFLSSDAWKAMGEPKLVSVFTDSTKRAVLLKKDEEAGLWRISQKKGTDGSKSICCTNLVAEFRIEPGVYPCRKYEGGIIIFVN